MKTIAHTADLHIGSNQYGIPKRQKAARLNIEKLGAEMKEFDYVIVSGDVFDSTEPSPDDLKCWSNFVNILKSGSVEKLFVSTGNHDKRDRSLFQYVDIPSSKELKVITPRNQGDNPKEIFVLDHHRRRDIPGMIESAPEEIGIIVCHQSAGGFLATIMKPELNEEQLTELASKCSYLAMGDLHVSKSMLLGGGKRIAAYPGNVDFLRLCDPWEDFGFNSITFDEESGVVSKVEKIKFEPYMRTRIVSFDTNDVSATARTLLENPDGFTIIRHRPSDYQAALDLKEMAEVDIPNAIVHLHKDRSPKAGLSSESGASSIKDGTNFMDIVRADKTLSEEDAELIADIWECPSNEGIEEILKQDLKNEIDSNENNQSNT